MLTDQEQNPEHPPQQLLQALTGPFRPAALGLWWPDTLSKFKWTSTPSKPDPASSKSSSAATRSKRSRDTRTSLLLQPGLLEPHAHLPRPSSCPAPPLPHLQTPFQPPYPPLRPTLLSPPGGVFHLCSLLCSSWPAWGAKGSSVHLGKRQ